MLFHILIFKCIFACLRCCVRVHSFIQTTWLPEEADSSFIELLLSHLVGSEWWKSICLSPHLLIYIHHIHEPKKQWLLEMPTLSMLPRAPTAIKIEPCAFVVAMQWIVQMQIRAHTFTASPQRHSQCCNQRRSCVKNDVQALLHTSWSLHKVSEVAGLPVSES